MENKKEITLDELATMIAEGFANTATKESVEQLQRDMDEVKLRLDNVAHRFEFVELEKRVEKLEEKVYSKIDGQRA